MSTPIRPPTGPRAPGLAGLEGTAPGGEIGRVGAADAAAPQAVERGSSVERADAAEAQGATASVLARLEAGELTREQAVESLVQEALEAYAGGNALAPRERAELEGVLRSALLDDPALGRLLG